MEVRVVNECGYEDALRGMAYSFKDRAEDPDTWWVTARKKAVTRASLLCGKGGGHDKFLRQLVIWVDISAPRCWWSEFDTYKVGTVAQSESTMHTLAKRPPTHADFSPETAPEMIDAFILKYPEIKHDVTKLKCALPEGYLQRRMVTMTYENVRSICKQRDKHRLKFWKQYLDQILPQLIHQEFLQGIRHAETD